MSWTEVILSRSGLASMLSGLLEGMGIPWPGAIVLTAAGSSAPDTTTAALLAFCFGLVYTGSAWLQYLLGRYSWAFLRLYIPKSHQERLQTLMQKHGEAAVLWTRPLAVGNFVSIPAGVAGMNPLKFLLYTFLGIMPWSLGMTLAGGVIGTHLSQAAKILTAAAVIVAALGAIPALHKATKAHLHKGGKAERPNDDAVHFAD